MKKICFALACVLLLCCFYSCDSNQESELTSIEETNQEISEAVSEPEENQEYYIYPGFLESLRIFNYSIDPINHTMDLEENDDILHWTLAFDSNNILKSVAIHDRNTDETTLFEWTIENNEQNLPISFNITGDYDDVVAKFKYNENSELVLWEDWHDGSISHKTNISYLDDKFICLTEQGESTIFLFSLEVGGYVCYVNEAPKECPKTSIEYNGSQKTFRVITDEAEEQVDIIAVSKEQKQMFDQFVAFFVIIEMYH